MFTSTVLHLWGFFLPLLLLSPLTSTGVTVGAQTCTLYDPPSPGIHCYYGNQVLEVLTRSRYAWMVELYSSWCGHCQHFAPRLKELAKEMEAWSDVVRIGVMECTGLKENQDMCNKMDVGGYPTIRLFRPYDSSPLDFKNSIVGARDIGTLRHIIVDHVTSVDPYPTAWPDFRLLENGSILEETASWVPAVLVFEEEQSYLGKELILDFSKENNLRVRRVSNLNVALVQHYSILEFPSAVVELSRGQHHVIPGHSVKDARSEFREKITGYLQKSAAARASRGRSHDRKSHDTRGSDLSHHRAAADAGHNVPHWNRVERRDLLGAISYALRAEVPLHAIISGSTYTSLLNFVSLLEQAFTGVSREGVSASLRAVRVKLEGRSQTGFITRKDWHRIMDSKLDSTLFPTRVRWRMCNGSHPHLRGYPCGLWLFMHTLTVLTLPLNHTHQPHQITSTRALTIVSSFIKNFFSCEVCRQHFVEMSRGISRRPMSDPGDAVLWAWEAHNLVNARLSLERASGDPLYPKQLFPSISRCPYCYLVSPGSSHATYDSSHVTPNFTNTRFADGESLVGVAERGEGSSHPSSRTMLRAWQQQSPEGASVYVWNRTAVILYLWNYYHLSPYHGNGTKLGKERRHHGVSQSAVLRAAWPQQFRSSKHFMDKAWQQSAKSADPEVCLLPYVVCVGVLALLLWILVRRRCRAVSWVRGLSW